MLCPVLVLFHHCCHMLPARVKKYLSHSGGRELCAAVLSPPYPSFLFPSHHQISFCLTGLGCGGTITKGTISAFDTRQCSSVIYLGKEMVPTNNEQMLTAISLSVWANKLHSSLISGNKLGLGNLDFLSKPWGKSTCIATYLLVLAHQTVCFPSQSLVPSPGGQRRHFIGLVAYTGCYGKKPKILEQRIHV